MDFYQRYQKCLQRSQSEQAMQYLQQHLQNNPRHAYGFFQAGNLFRSLEQWPQALNAFCEACRLDPEQSELHTSLGIIYNQMQKPESAIASFNTACEKSRDPGIRYNRAMAMLLSGRYREGWKEHEYRLQVPHKKVNYEWHPALRPWQGQPFSGQTLVIYNEQGLGDDIQFCRYLPSVKALGGNVVFVTSRSLIPVMSTLYGVDQVVERNQVTHEALGKFQWVVPLMSLPYIFRTTLDSIPNQMPYLSVPSSYREKWQILMKPYMTQPAVKKIGLVYASRPGHLLHRTSPLAIWSSLFSLPGLQWFSVQKGDETGALQKLAANQFNIVDLTDNIDDFGDTAALLEQLDLLISVDTSVPHLAGALGKPVWLLLPFISEWRWLLHRSDSPWYPSFRLFRQPAPGQWQPVMDQVRQALFSM